MAERRWVKGHRLAAFTAAGYARVSDDKAGENAELRRRIADAKQKELDTRKAPADEGLYCVERAPKPASKPAAASKPKPAPKRARKSEE